MSNAELTQVREMWEGLAAGLLPPAGPVEWRIGFDQMFADFPIASDARIESVDAGGCPALLVTAVDATTDAVVLWIHSGGYCFGSPRAYRSFGAGLSAASGASVLLLDYRLAPENQYPAALDDAKAAYRWLLAQGREPASIVVGGDSAGGALATATLLALHDDGDPMPAAGVLVSPMADLTLSGESMQTRADRDPVASAPMLAALGGLYAGDAPVGSRYLSPALADLTGLPPLLVLVGSEEIMHDDAVRIVDGATAAGGEARLLVGDGQFHIWPLFAPILTEGQEALEEIGSFVRRSLHAPVTG